MKIADLIQKLSTLPADDEILLEWHDEIEAIYWSRKLPRDATAWILSPHEDDKETEALGRYQHEDPNLWKDEEL